MRVQEVVLGVQAGAVATKGVLDDACAAGYRERSDYTVSIIEKRSLEFLRL